MKLTSTDFLCIGVFLEGFLFGFYSGIFCMYLQYHARKKKPDKQSITFYALCVLFMLTMVLISINIATFVDIEMLDHLGDCQIAVFACCDFIAQSILIYRCYIVWDRNIRVVTIPSILAFASLVMWMASIGSSNFGVQRGTTETSWSFKLSLTSLAASMTVNALVTGLIVLKISKVFHRVKDVFTSVERSSRMTRGGSKLRSICFIIIESAVILFAIQLTRPTIGIIPLCLNRSPDTLLGVSYIMVCIHSVFNGITPTIILVRAVMGFSFHDEPSLVESVSSLQFAVNHPNLATSGMRGIDGLDKPKSLHTGIGPDEPVQNRK